MSDAVLERKIGSRKSQSVSESLAHDQVHHSDQAEVWDGIQALYCKAGFSSPTSAMHDVFKARADRLNECLRAFPRQEGQGGLLVIISGQVAGFDIVSRPEVYARLHEKLVRSYVLDALLEEAQPAKPVADGPEVARAFIASLESSREEVVPSVGYGQDHRYHAAGLTGSVLVHGDRLIHRAFLSLDRQDAGNAHGHLSLLRRRRASRQG